jgi:hypothetical protein
VLQILTLGDPLLVVEVWKRRMAEVARTCTWLRGCSMSSNNIFATVRTLEKRGGKHAFAPKYCHLE